MLGIDDLALIWNRAALRDGGATPGPGDRALADALRLHGLAMNGGLLHALEALQPAEIESATAGLRYLQLIAAADAIVVVCKQLEEDGESDVLESKANRLYSNALPRDDGDIDAAFRAAYAARPSDFARPSASDRAE